MLSTDTTDATSARHRRCHISAACRGSYNVSLYPSSVLTTSACAHHQFLQRQPVPIIGSYNVSLCPSSVLTTSACAHHWFLQRQPVPIISSYNVSLCPSSVLTTSACARHRFHPLQNTFFSSSLNVSVLTSWLPRLICGDFPKLQCCFGFGSSSLSVVPVAVTVSGDCHVSRSDGKC